MDIHDLFSVNGDSDGELPEPNVKMRLQDDNNEWTPEQVKGLICNPIYAGIGPYPALVEDNVWVQAAAKVIDNDGKEQFLVNLLYLLRKSFLS